MSNLLSAIGGLAPSTPAATPNTTADISTASPAAPAKPVSMAAVIATATSTASADTTSTASKLQPPPLPSPDANDDEIVEYYIANINYQLAQATGGKTALADLSNWLKENPTYELSPHSMQTVTKAISTITVNAHATATVKKKVAEKKISASTAKAEKAAAIAALL